MKTISCIDCGKERKTDGQLSVRCRACYFEKRREFWNKNCHKLAIIPRKLWPKEILDAWNLRRKERRHKEGISKEYQNGLGVSKTKEYQKAMRHKRRHAGVKLTRETVQLVYEDNIKKYGTLTCYLCIKPIVFGKDHLEHKTPISRGGTNEYNNLGIACQTCNCKKHTKTVEEFQMKGNF